MKKDICFQKTALAGAAGGGSIVRMRISVLFICFAVTGQIFVSPVRATGLKTIGVPSGKFRNRWFTHPKAAQVYTQNKRSLKKKKTVRYRAIYSKGKIWTTDYSQKKSLTIKKGELRWVGEAEGVLVSR